MLTIVYQRLLTLKRNMTMVILMFILPLVFTAVFGGMQGSGAIPVAYTDLDNSEASQRFIQNLSTTGLYKMVELTEEELLKSIEGNSYEFGLVIPLGYQNNLSNGNDTEVEIVRSKETVNLMAFQGVAMAAHQRVDSDYRMVNATVEVFNRHGKGDQEVKSRLYYLLDDNWRDKSPINTVSENWSQDSQSDFDPLTHTSLGFLLFFSMFTIVFIVSEILDDKQNKVWDRLVVSPMSKLRIYGGNILYTFIVGFIKIMLLIAVGKYVFGVKWAGNVFGITLVVSAFILATSGVGVMLAGIIKTPQQLQSIAPVIIVGTSMLGGCYWPLEMITSKVLLTLAKFTPQYWALGALKDIALKGAALSDVMLPLGVLLGMFILLVSAGVALKETA